MRSLDAVRRAPAAWLGIALALLAMAAPAYAAAGGPQGSAGPDVVRPMDALEVPDAPALTQNAPTASLLVVRDAGPRAGGAGGAGRSPQPAATPPAPVAVSGAGPAAAARPDGDADRALHRAGRAGAPATAPPFLSF